MSKELGKFFCFALRNYSIIIHPRARVPSFPLSFYYYDETVLPRRVSILQERSEYSTYTLSLRLEDLRNPCITLTALDYRIVKI